ncbi:hypothetical protein HYU20_02545 [Candidatus Woesearchaeota archaeon]|nr:hypothetical protein [Candidatus Woesearchaeota archaeon]
MKRFAKVMALFALFLLTLAVFDRLQPTITTTTPISGFAVYEIRQLTWDFDDQADYDFNSSLINVSGGEAKLKLQKVLKELKNQTTLTIQQKSSGKYNKKLEFESEPYSYKGALKTLYFDAETPAQTSVKLKIRTASSQQALEEAEWQPKGKDYYTTTEQAITAEPNGYLQYKVVLETDDDAKTPALKSVTITYETEEYPTEAAITTKEYSFSRSVEVQKLTTEEQLNGQAVKYEYSTDSGQAWKTPVSGQILAAAADRVVIKATLSSNKTETPSVRDIRLSYKISICDEKWQPNYTSCNKSNSMVKYYTDANSCGSTEDLPADNGTAESCDYCTPKWTNLNSSCRNDDTTEVNYIYTNTCCQETGLASDCAIPANTTSTCDFCKPLWQETNGSCGKDDKITAAYNDANGCYAATGLQSDNNKPANKTHTCDYCTPSFSCSGYGDCTEDNKKACTQASDSNSCYGKTGLASDNYTGSYSEFSASCAFDSESPVISSVTAAVSGSTLTITASITDKSATTATAQLVKDGAAVMNVTLANTTKDTYAASASAAGLKGAYVIVIVAKDKHNNTARTKGITGIAVQAEKSAEADVVLNLSRKSVLSLTNTTTIELAGKAEQSATGKLIISEHKSDIRNSTKPSGKRELQKYVEVEADEELKSNISSATLRISYTDEEALAANLSEESLALHFYNETSLVWQQLNSTANTALNYVEGNTTHLSLFGIFGSEQNQTANITANATVNATLTNATNETAANTTNQTAANQTAGAAVNETSSAQQPQQQGTETAGGGGAGGAAEKRQAEKKTEAEKEEATPAAKATEADDCSYEVKAELAGKPSFINTTRVNASVVNTGTCALQSVEIKLTKPLDSYISVENGSAAELGPAESLAFSLKLKAPSGEAQKQPLQGFTVKEPRKKAVYAGKIIITGQGVKGLGLDIEAAGPKLEEEVPVNIEVYELEQNGGKALIATAIIAAFILLGVLGIGYSAMAKKRNRGNGRETSGGNSVTFLEKRSIKNEDSTAKEASPTPEPEHETQVERSSTGPSRSDATWEEKLSFEEKLKTVSEKWDQRQQDGENSNSGSSEGEDK